MFRKSPTSQSSQDAQKGQTSTNPTLARRDAPCPKQGHSEQRGEEVRTALVEPFAHTVNLGERDIPSSAPDIRGIPSQR